MPAGLNIGFNQVPDQLHCAFGLVTLESTGAALTSTGSVQPLNITNTSPVPPAYQSVTYSDTMIATGGVPPYKFITNIVVGTGSCNINYANGYFVFNCSNVETDSFFVQVTDSAVPTPNVYVKTFSIQVLPTFAATPIIYPAGGQYANTQLVNITAPQIFNSIYYTLDGSTPSSTNGTLYTVPFNVSGPTPVTVNAVTYATGYTPSPVATTTYTFGTATVNNKRLPYSPSGIKVSGNSLSNGTNLGILMGVNLTGLEFIPVQEAFTGAGESGDWAGTAPNFSTLATYNVNCVRIPLNAASWLGLTCSAITQTGTAIRSTANADYNGTYRASVNAAITAANNIGCYVILDLHWSAPKITLNGSTFYCAPLGQPLHANTDTDILFWTSIAQTYASNPTVMFELFNESFINTYTNETNARNLALNGGTAPTFLMNGYNYTNLNYPWTILGWQSMINTIRQYATNIVIVGGQSYTQSMRYRIADLPVDPLGNMAFSWHPYPNTYTNYAVSPAVDRNPWPYTAYGPYPLVGADTGYAAPSASDIQYGVSVIANGYPVIITEDGGKVGTNYSSTTANPLYPYQEPHVAYMMYDFCDTYGASYIAWEYNNMVGYGTTDSDNRVAWIGSQTGNLPAPCPGEGQTFYNWTTGHS